MSKNGADFRTSGGTKGIVRADGFQTGSGPTAPDIVVNTTITFDPPSLTTGAVGYSSGITVTGAALGDSVELYPPYDLQGVISQGQVSAANTIKIALINSNSGTVDLASGTWGVVVKRR